MDQAMTTKFGTEVVFRKGQVCANCQVSLSQLKLDIVVRRGGIYPPRPLIESQNERGWKNRVK